jgi:hypothetical protein
MPCTHAFPVQDAQYTVAHVDGIFGTLHTSSVVRLHVDVIPTNDAPVLDMPGSIYDPVYNVGDNLSPLVIGFSTFNVTEDVDTIVRVTLRDVDAMDSGYGHALGESDGLVEVEIASDHGTVTLGNGDRNLIAGGVKAPVQQLVAGTGFRDRRVRFRATVANANVALNTLVYATVPHYYGPDVLRVSVWDLGNSGTLAAGPTNTGSNATSTAPTHHAPVDHTRDSTRSVTALRAPRWPLSDSLSLPLLVHPVNDGPVAVVPAVLLTAYEDADLYLTGFTVADVDTGGLPGVGSGVANDSRGVLTATLTVLHGTVTLQPVLPNGTITFLVGDGNRDRNVTFRGLEAHLNQAMRGATFKSAHHWNSLRQSPDSITLLVEDHGEFGAGLPLSHEATVYVHVVPVNDAPVITVPGETRIYGENEWYEVSEVAVQYPHEDEPYVLGGRLSNAPEQPVYAPVGQSGRIPISIFDQDVAEADGQLEVLLTAEHGTLTITATEGLQFLRLPGDEPPIAFEDGQQNPVNGNGVGNGVGLGVATGEPRRGLGPQSADFVGLGQGLGVRQAAILFRGPTTRVNNALDGLIFVSDLNYFGNASVTIHVSDLGYTDASFSEGLSLLPLVVPAGASSGRGSPATGQGALTDTVVMPLVVLPVNDVPVWVVPPNVASLVVEEETELHIDGVAVFDDVDSLQYTLYATVDIGSLTMSRSSPNLTFTVGRGLLDRVVVANGTLNDVNRALASMVYVPRRQFDSVQNHRDFITLTILDNPGAGRGPPGGHNVTTVIYVTRVLGVNDKPVIHVPGMHVIMLPDCEEGPIPVKNVNVTCGATYSVDNIEVFEDVPRLIPVSITDLDLDYTYAASVDVTVSSPFGLLSLGPVGGLAFARGDGVRDPIVRFHASLVSTNAALAGLTYVSGPHYYGSDNITITVSDQGFTGRGGALYDVKTIPLTVRPMNDPVSWDMPVRTQVWCALLLSPPASSADSPPLPLLPTALVVAAAASLGAPCVIPGFLPPVPPHPPPSGRAPLWPLQALRVMEDLQLKVPVSFSDIDVPRVIQRYLVEISAGHGTLQLQRYNRLQFFNISRDGHVDGEEEDFEALIASTQVRCMCALALFLFSVLAPAPPPPHTQCSPVPPASDPCCLVFDPVGVIAGAVVVLAGSLFVCRARPWRLRCSWAWTLRMRSSRPLSCG